MPDNVQKLNNFRKVFDSKSSWVVICLLIVSNVVTGYVLYERVSQAREEIAKRDMLIDEKEKEITDVNQKRASLEAEKNVAEKGSTIYAASFLAINEGFDNISQSLDDLDALLLQDDEKNRAMINWLRENGEFAVYDGTYAMASVKFDDWDSYMRKSDARYSIIKSDLESDMASLEDTFSAIVEYKDSSGTMTQVH